MTLKLKGLIYGLVTERPRPDDLKELPQIELSSSAPCNPSSNSFSKAEEQFSQIQASIAVQSQKSS
jgi:hypothetical protein